MSDTTPIPTEQRTKLLKPFLVQCYDKLKEIPLNNSPIPLSTILMLWDKNNPLYERDESGKLRSEINSVGIKGNELRTELITDLEWILEDDSHLKICCGGEPLNLATTIDLFYLSNILRISKEGDGLKLDVFYYPIFENLIYITQYRRTAYFHLFNFEMEETKK